ncbi:MAG TPA: methionyl-tRNA formyltransferase [Candidatus Moranbacteria bacterium]|nr:methionyl-tRNA formyltransferase [Candidatus Moranbacteria bacterium]HRY27764.1 methionyl-tRNA formyltransferase [Candidatus Moranbacteria bacterium]HSA08157.1 methionyl-tRNA formyltransferase [Candidatus Moranbacteria bacterium]
MKKTDEKQIKIPIVFMGTSKLSESVLKALLEKNYVISGVFTKPDKKIGRKQEISEPLVKKLANENKIPVFQPEKFDEESIAELKKLKPDLIIVAAYGKIIPQAILDIPGFGCINVHASLLPKYRGPSPIQNALMNGEKETGITIMLMDKGIDTGDILSQESINIEPNDNNATLLDKLSVVGANLLIKTLPPWIERGIQPKPQENSSATICQLIERSDGHINWTDDAEDIFNRYRALTPWPGIFCYWKSNSDTIRLKMISIEKQKISPQQKYAEGEVFEIADDIGVQAGNGVIILKEIQSEGKNVMTVQEFKNGHPDFIGSILK